MEPFAAIPPDRSLARSLGHVSTKTQRRARDTRRSPKFYRSATLGGESTFSVHAPSSQRDTVNWEGPADEEAFDRSPVSRVLAMGADAVADWGVASLLPSRGGHREGPKHPHVCRDRPAAQSRGDAVVLRAGPSPTTWTCVRGTLNSPPTQDEGREARRLMQRAFERERSPRVGYC